MRLDCTVARFDGDGLNSVPNACPTPPNASVPNTLCTTFLAARRWRRPRYCGVRPDPHGLRPASAVLHGATGARRHLCAAETVRVQDRARAALDLRGTRSSAPKYLVLACLRLMLRASAMTGSALQLMRRCLRSTVPGVWRGSVSCGDGGTILRSPIVSDGIEFEGGGIEFVYKIASTRGYRGRRTSSAAHGVLFYCYDRGYRHECPLCPASPNRCRRGTHDRPVGPEGCALCGARLLHALTWHSYYSR